MNALIRDRDTVLGTHKEQYAGLHDKDRAFMLAGLLDTLALQLDRVDSAVRRDAVFACRWLLGERGT